MLEEEVIGLVEKDADFLTKKWQEAVSRNTSTPTYHTFPPKKLYYRGHVIFSEFGLWLKKSEEQGDMVKGYFLNDGKERLAEGFALHELISSLILMKKVLWDYAQGLGLANTVFDFSRLLPFNNQIVKFFDRAIYYTVIGYEMGLGERFQSKGFWGYFLHRAPKPAGKGLESAVRT